MKHYIERQSCAIYIECYRFFRGEYQKLAQVLRCFGCSAQEICTAIAALRQIYFAGAERALHVSAQQYIPRREIIDIS
ncbi:hypothetical protein BD293_3437 [Roseinatronobacter monicus]|uniref:Uncharacterized protein n=1 Tax=Roseinatronobacter monicus TaxID=393481 RepID=A0A543KI45_9RHOB|nr:hypothetical protein BD293_3437 [Roseinatronobacter monicus]